MENSSIIENRFSTLENHYSTMENTTPSKFMQLSKTDSTTTTTTRLEQEYQEVFVTIPPDGGWGWMVVFGAFFCLMVVDGIGYSFGVFLGPLAKDLGCTKSEVSMATAIATGVICTCGPFAASLVNNYGYRIVGVTGSILSIVSCVMTSMSKSIYFIYFTYGVIGGIGYGMIVMSAIIAVGFYFEKWRGFAIGISTCGSGLGGITLPLVFVVIQDKIGWRNTFRIIAALMFAVGMFTTLFKPIAPVLIRKTKLNVYASGNFFTTYNNRMFPTLSEVTEVPTVTLLQPRKLNKSSEVMIMSYPSSSMKCRFKDDEETLKEPHQETSKYSKTESRQEPFKLLKSEYRQDQSRFSKTETRQNLSRLSRLEPRQDQSRVSRLEPRLDQSRLSRLEPRLDQSRLSRIEPRQDQSKSRKDPDSISSREQSQNKNISTLYMAKNRRKKLFPLDTPTCSGVPMRPLYRDDIFYDSSFNFLQKYKKSEQISQKSGTVFSKSNLEYHLSVTRATTARDLEETRCKICTEAIKRTLATMLDYKLLKSPSFLIIAFHGFFLSLGFFTTYIFIKDRAEQTGLSKNAAFWLISIIGAANTAGRIVCGIIANFPIEFTWVSAVCLLLGGLSTIVYVHFDAAIIHTCYAVTYGGLVACVPALRTLIIVDTLGLENLTNAFGLILMFQGVAFLIGITMSGMLRDATGDYKWSFYFSGLSIIISALLFFPLKHISKWEKRKKEKNLNSNPRSND